MITISIKEHYGAKAITREHGLRLRSLLQANWSETDKFEIDFSGLKIASVSFFDEAFGKLAMKYVQQELKEKMSLKNIDDFDRQLLNDVIRARYKRVEGGEKK